MKKYFYIYILLFPVFSLLSFSCHRSSEIAAEFHRSSAGFAVLEMFTSEGCSSCPPAYKVAEKLQNEAEKNNENLILLDFHVDYWNYMGWTDPFSDSLFSKRQKDYSVALKNEDIYTPQAVVNGKIVFVGSQYQKAKDAVHEVMHDAPKGNLKITSITKGAGDSLVVGYEIDRSSAELLLNIAVTENKVISNVQKGENAGRTLTHFNVVRMFKTIPVTAEKGTLKIAMPSMNSGSGYKLVGFVQNRNSMEILAADEHGVNMN